MYLGGLGGRWAEGVWRSTFLSVSGVGGGACRDHDVEIGADRDPDDTKTDFHRFSPATRGWRPRSQADGAPTGSSASSGPRTAI